MSPNRRWQQLARRRPWLRTRKRILIVCEGEVTETTYFKDIGRRVRTHLEIQAIGPAGVPVTAVRKAVAIKKASEAAAKKEANAFLKYDEIWCAIDVDNHQNISQALDQARANGINVAISNPCFELWILLHFQDQRKHIDRVALKSLCKKHIPKYEKVPPCDLLHSKRQLALGRGKELEKWQSKMGRTRENPSTGVYRLVERIIGLTDESIVSQLRTN
jgi:hypothetical protein